MNLTREQIIRVINDLLEDAPYVQTHEGCECGDGGSVDCVHMRACDLIDLLGDPDTVIVGERAAV